MPAPLTSEQINAFRQRLCAVAERQFSERGLKGVSMRSLAEELGCSATSPYRYFENKDAILAAVRAGAFNRLSDGLEAAFTSSSDPWEQSRAVGDAYVRFAFDDPGAYRLIFALTQPDEERYPELATAVSRSRDMMMRYVERLVECGLLVGDPEVLSHIFWAGAHGLIALQMAGKLSTGNPSFETLRHEMNRLITRGASPATPLTIRPEPE